MNISKEINELPKHIRDYIHELESTVPADLVQEVDNLIKGKRDLFENDAVVYRKEIKELQAEKKELINGINKVIEALQNPLNSDFIVDTLWMPDMQACTVVDYLSLLTP